MVRLFHTYNLFCSYIGSPNIFTIVPMTQYVYVNDNVTFECATNVAGEYLFFIVNGAPPAFQTSSTQPNGGILISTSIKATSQSNGTGVTCYTFSGNTTKKAYVYVQG